MLVDKFSITDSFLVIAYRLLERGYRTECVFVSV